MAFRQTSLTHIIGFLRDVPFLLCVDVPANEREH
jgi:hypothetical protein